MPKTIIKKLDRKKPVVLFWDFDGVLNQEFPIKIYHQKHLKSIFEILSSQGVLSVPASQRCSYKDTNEQEKSVKDEMYAAFDQCFGKNRSYLLKKHGDAIAKNVDADKTGKSKNYYLENTKNIGVKYGNIPNSNLILIDDNKVYRTPTEKGGYVFSI
ncbi:hypothetical protein [Piscirickettsia litoralis]|uniref:Uncharacterized protein n=1 Tax=Piscirickettsia litoralis TaxID=1891921 RepID=A0ABX3A608_9GAMM|nr:hypothetical protein [Piscirickettsia litoralis]ODN43878.1 hypothetical protein BGC07_14505 [Piscirickettsia litoralis]